MATGQPDQRAPLYPSGPHYYEAHSIRGWFFYKQQGPDFLDRLRDLLSQRGGDT